MARTWFGEIPSCCSLTLLPGPAWIPFKYVLQTIFSGSVHVLGQKYASGLMSSRDNP